MLQECGTLFNCAAARSSATIVSGRGVAQVATLLNQPWLVRHYRRGGSVARYLGDRYLRSARPRALRELLVSAGARARGVATPEVAAAAWYPSGWYLRQDIALRYIPFSADLASILFGERKHQFGRTAAVRASAQLLASLCRHGLLHADLNLNNILIDGSGSSYVLDLDRCRLVEGSLSTRQRARMRRRLLRSLEKWERQSDQLLSSEDRRLLEAAFDA